ncbi:MutS-related protein [Psychrobacillus psychrodurans]|uniref:MutS-related protein n=1 Tax=Psychrobacillus psychrodurans TaxID=126157 RepID=UPI003D087F1A
MLNPIVIALIIVGAIIVYHLLTKNKKKLIKIRNEWETGEFVQLNLDFNSISSYWSNRHRNSKNYVGLDQLTWDDLAMNDVFQKLNYTQSTVGSEYLFNQLRDINPSKKQNEEELYRLIAADQQLREEILLILSRLGKQNYTNSSSFIYDLKDNKIKYAYFYVIFSLFPVASILLLFFSLKYGIVSLISSLCINTFIYYRNKMKLENDLYSVGYVAAIINTGKRIANLRHPKLLIHIKDLKKNVQPIKKVITFNKIASFGSGSGGEFDVLLEYLRILFLLDFISYNNIIKTISTHQKEYFKVWTIIGKMDAAIAIAFYRKSMGTYCTPTFTDKEELFFENMAHPLITKPVSNTSSLGKCTLVTGSNASGKSTYIKAVAINAILAQTINTVIAERWTMKPSYIVTSMAIQDNVLNGDSYFIAEIKSLNRIIKLIEEGKPCLSFIDEILKGTNTIERIAASAAIMEWLSLNNGMNVLASHDIELTEIAENMYVNYHFRESIENGEVRFDYKIHSGPSKSRNAIKLLEMLRYPKSITNRSNRLAQNFTKKRKWDVFDNGNKLEKSSIYLKEAENKSSL